MKPIAGTTLEYETEYVGKVKITLPAYTELLEGDFERYIIAGICKDKTLKNEDPVLIDSNFIREGYKKLNPPLQFEEKCIHFLKYLYQFGGKDNKEFEIDSTKHFPLAFSDAEEFTRIVDQLKNDGFISIRKTHQMSRSRESQLHMGVKVTNAGKIEAQKSMPKMPLFGLVNQEITTGNHEFDEKINHARQLFFDDNPSLDKMRSACEALSYILEPLREDLKSYFNQKDVSDFFQIVNTFDIRHNKDTTKNLIHKEQLEWVFYSLLNTINAYTKLKQRGL
ncbi:hypothetical protein [Chryseobacterium sp. POE27]|uniref:hypothetical protein n=1 Tax=Chryseobacterium sp. POE27 TaxID=3138177 RepID=UPI00321A8F0A